MRFLVDNQLPAALARALSARGEDCRHVLDVGLAQATDPEIWRYCGENGLVLISKDDDFVRLATEPGSHARFIWVRMGNCRNADLLTTIDRVWHQVRTALDAGDRLIEIR